MPGMYFGRSVCRFKASLGLIPAFLLVIFAVIPAHAQSAPEPLLKAWLTGKRGMPADVAELPSHARWGAFYATRGYRPIWFEGGSPTARVGQLSAALQRLQAEGIDLPQASALLEGAPTNMDAVVPAPLAEEAAAAAELRLTDSLLTAALALSGGATRPQEQDPAWYLPPPVIDLRRIEALVAGETDLAEGLVGLAPRTAEYRRLREALANFRALAQGGEWEVLDEGATLRPGEISPEVPVLRRRLIQGGDLDVAAEAMMAEVPEFYDDTLAEAVARFQSRHGLDPDGAVGPKTRAALNVPLSQRIAQLRVALERLRWMPRAENGRYLLVNTAGFRLTLYDRDQPELEMRVIVGLPDKKWATPSFTAPVRYLVLNPYWNIPRNILREEVLPDALADPDYLEKKRIRLLDDEGEEVTLGAEELQQLAQEGRFPYRLRQDSGDGNALGRIKLMLPNQFDIYLHDTNRRGLFQRSYRAFSHGCIRLEKPFALAARLLGGDWDEAKLNEASVTAKNRILNLPEPVPAYIVYLTAWVDADGTVQFREDHYGRDARLLATFRRQPAERLASQVKAPEQAM